MLSCAAAATSISHPNLVSAQHTEHCGVGATSCCHQSSTTQLLVAAGIFVLVTLHGHAAGVQCATALVLAVPAR
jgi:hypothetical protein